MVTGVSGFVGSRLASKLSKNHKVFGLVREFAKNKRDLPKKITLIKGDLNNYQSLDKALKNIDVVFHSAAALPYHNLNTKEYFRVNKEGTANMVKAAIKNKVKKFIHVSTVGVYAKTQQQDAYSKSKLEAEEEIKSAVKKGLRCVIIRPTIAYGPGDLRPGFLDLFRIINKNLLITISGGTNHFHTVYIDNLIDGLLLAMTNPKAINEDFIIGDLPVPRMIDILKIMAKLQQKSPFKLNIPHPLAIMVGRTFDALKGIGVPQILNTRRVAFLSDERIFDIQKAQKTIGYKPKISLKIGLEKTLAWYKQNGYL